MAWWGVGGQPGVESAHSHSRWHRVPWGSLSPVITGPFSQHSNGASTVLWDDQTLPALALLLLMGRAGGGLGCPPAAVVWGGSPRVLRL